MNNNDNKGPGKRGHIVAGTLLPMMFLGLHKLGNICCGHKMFLNKIRNIFLCLGHKIGVRNKCCVRGQTGKHLCRQQCVLVCQGLKVLMSWHYIGLIVAPWKFDALKTSIFALKTSDFCWEAISRQPSTKAFY